MQTLIQSFPFEEKHCLLKYVKSFINTAFMKSGPMLWLSEGVLF